MNKVALIKSSISPISLVSTINNIISNKLDGSVQGTSTLTGGTLELDCATGNSFTITATGNITITFKNTAGALGSVISLVIKNGGSYMVSHTGVQFPSGAPMLTGTGTDMILYLLNLDGSIYGSSLINVKV